MADFSNKTKEESTSVPVENEEPSLFTLEMSDNTNEDVKILRKEGYGVYGNNDPAPENIPTHAAKDDKVTYND